jgi:hypothetical protein
MTSHRSVPSAGPCSSMTAIGKPTSMAATAQSPVPSGVTGRERFTKLLIKALQPGGLTVVVPRLIDLLLPVAPHHRTLFRGLEYRAHGPS